ncbi:MAG TPA: hypothetical protein VFH11_05345 [Gemmatimonadota bacterium]|nr:hypothetical protein [Gemmatimonadota bacterium]
MAVAMNTRIGGTVLRSRPLVAIGRAALDLLPGSLPLVAKDWVNRVRLPEYREIRNFESHVLSQLGHPATVLSGPFAGMPYSGRAHHSRLLPKLLGTYEKELHGVFEVIRRIEPDLIVDVGAAEGYYVTGFARLCPSARIVAFEMERSARALLRAACRRCRIESRVQIRGLCTIAQLRGALAGASKAVLLADCEGAENELLDPATIPDLSSATILVETHDAKVPGVGARIESRFEATHAVEQIRTRVRTPADLPPGTLLSDQDALEAMTERSLPQIFLFMRPRNDRTRA